MSDQGLVGRVGTVVTAVRGGEHSGEVRVVVEGIPHYYLAFCAKPVPIGNEVLVVNNRGAQQVDVEPWSLWPLDDGSVGSEAEE